MLGWYLQLVAIIALDTGLVLWPPRRPRGLASAAFFVSHLVNELPGVALAALLGGTVLALVVGGLASAGGAAILTLMTLTGLGLLEIVRRGLMAGAVVETALDEALGCDWRSIAGRSARTRRRRLARALLAPLPVLPLNVQRVRNVNYGPGHLRNRLDVYRRRGPAAAGCPGADPLPRRPLPDRRQEPRVPTIAARARPPGLGLRQRHLPTRCSRALPELADRRQAGDLLGSLTRRRIWRRSLGRDRGRELGRSTPGGNGRPHPQRSGIPTRLRGRGHRRERRDLLPLPGAGHSFDLFHSPRFEQVICAMEAFTAWVRLKRDAPPDGDLLVAKPATSTVS